MQIFRLGVTHEDLSQTVHICYNAKAVICKI